MPGRSLITLAARWAGAGRFGLPIAAALNGMREPHQQNLRASLGLPRPLHTGDLCATISVIGWGRYWAAARRIDDLAMPHEVVVRHLNQILSLK